MQPPSRAPIPNKATNNLADIFVANLAKFGNSKKTVELAVIVAIFPDV
jgi:hypothetical protein